ncbi:MAG: GH116 family glycosyl-hydrolase [Victivallaceae bacterium]|nr:GH116 family glycosyl-hydrolase [Victivallaceae bacterium]
MRKYTGKKAEKISFPLGGIGTGCIGLTGNGQLVDWEIFNRPNKLTFNGFSHFAVRAEENGKVIDARILAGEFNGNKMGTHNYLSPSNIFGFGAPRESLGGAPHFKTVSFESEFPFAVLRFSDPDFPAEITLQAFNPFIPLNPHDSSIPGALFQIEIHNTTARKINYTVVLAVNNPWNECYENNFDISGKFKRITLSDRSERNADDTPNQIVIATDSETVSKQENWFKGSWFDGLGVYFKELRTPGAFINRFYGKSHHVNLPGGLNDLTSHALLAAHKQIEPARKYAFKMVIAWRIADCKNDWDDTLDEAELSKQNLVNHWRNHYATAFASAGEVADYLLKEFPRLLRESKLFSTTFYATTIPKVFLEAAGCNLSILKTPTCLRLEDGSFYGFEGCAPMSGCCEGSCSHVWNYAYALAYLFPSLERSMRNLEYQYNLQPSGELTMRLMLPLGRPPRYRACADGQFGTIVKTYREWKISGDDSWLRSIWPKVKLSLQYTWNPENPDLWDVKKSGMLTGRQHHTLDMELFGPNSWLTGFYLAALDASAQMADFVGEKQFAQECRALFKTGKEQMDRSLFNGEYFFQQVNLSDISQLAVYAKGNWAADKKQRISIYDAYWDSDHGQLKYQIGQGCCIDQVLGQWHASLLGLNEIFDPEKRKKALRSIYRYNFKEEIGKIFNPCRLYSLGAESGTIICEWPEEKEKPWIPLPYAEETMHGFEYAFACQLLQCGLLKESERIVQAVRDRHDGENRNPWNEMECGSNYARSMASYAFLPAWSGFLCDASQKRLTFDPHFLDEQFISFWSMGTAWGSIECTKSSATLHVLYGTLELKELILPFLSCAGRKYSQICLLNAGESITINDEK